MAPIKDIDYLFISTRVRALEANLLTRDRMTRMLETPNADDATKILTECGYPEMSPLSIDTMNEVLANEHLKLFNDLASQLPDPSLIEVFRMKYDYHNVKVLLKAEAMHTEPESLLMDMGRVPVVELEEKLNSSDLRGIPTILQTAINKAKETLGSTRDPQLSDFVLDHAYYEDMFQLAKESGSKFLEGYIKISIDAANLRTCVRTMRMGKSAEYMRDLLFAGGNMDITRVLSAASAGGSLADLFALSPLSAAAEAGANALAGASLTEFERLCDNAITDYLKTAKFVPFGEAPVVSYLAAKENEFTAVRIILTGRMANIAPQIIQERLRDSYV